MERIDRERILENLQGTLGVPGAMLSDLLMQLFGLAAIAFVLSALASANTPL